MKLEWLEAVAAVAKYHSFSEAAETIPCAQSSVSRYVRSAEDELGVILFDRASNSNSVSLTPEGECIRPLIEQLLEDWVALQNATPACRAHRQFSVRLGLDRWMFSSSSKGNLISALYLSCPEIQLSIHEVLVEKRVEALLLKEIDAALMPRALPMGADPVPLESNDSVRYELVGTQPLSIAFGGSLLPAGRESITLRELNGLPIIFHTDIVKRYRAHPATRRHDYFVKACLDSGFAPNEAVDVVIRPEDIDIVPVEQGQLVGTVTNVTFKGMQYDIIVDFRGFKWLIQTTDHSPVGARIGVKIDPDGFHIMKKSEYSGQFGDYSSYSEEYEELADASWETDEEESGDEE